MRNKAKNNKKFIQREFFFENFDATFNPRNQNQFQGTISKHLGSDTEPDLKS